jgi:hypothetical protein
MAPKRGVFFAVAVCALACCGSSDDLERYYPLASGLTWEYRVSLTRHGDVAASQATVENLPAATVLGQTGVPQRSETFGHEVIRYLADDDRGIFEFAQQSGGNALVKNDPVDYVLKVPLATGTTWASTWQSTHNGSNISFPTVKAISGTKETVMVTAGTFIDCVHVKITGKADVSLASRATTIEVLGDEWYAPNVGFIKGSFREQVNLGEAVTELGMDLQSFALSR